MMFGGGGDRWLVSPQDTPLGFPMAYEYPWTYNSPVAYLEGDHSITFYKQPVALLFGAIPNG